MPSTPKVIKEDSAGFNAKIVKHCQRGANHQWRPAQVVMVVLRTGVLTKIGPICDLVDKPLLAVPIVVSGRVREGQSEVKIRVLRGKVV